MSLEIIQIPVSDDFYDYLIQDKESGLTASIDPASAEGSINAADQRNWKIDYILNTHHHFDHVGGNLEIQKRYDSKIVCFEGDKHRIPGYTQTVKDGDTFQLGESRANVKHLPGHTTGHIAYHFSEDLALFSGDVLFAMGCGRLFEGSAKQMWESLKWIRNLDTETKVYCAHEYTLSNAEFSLDIDSNNEALKRRYSEVQKLRSQSQPTVPFQISEEVETNPFLRADSKKLAEALSMEDCSADAIFAEIRRRKDHF